MAGGSYFGQSYLGEEGGAPPPNSNIDLSGDGIASAEVVGTPTVKRMLSIVDVSGGGIASGEAFGTPTVELLLSVIEPSGIPASGAAGGESAMLGGGALGTGYLGEGPGSTGDVGTPTLVQRNVLRPTGVTSGEAVGIPTITTGPVDVDLSGDGIPTGEAFGSPTLRVVTQVEPVGIPSGEAFGTPTIVIPAGRLLEIYVEAESQLSGSGHLDAVYVETGSILQASARLDQLYVEVLTRVNGWRGWGIPI